MIDRSLRRTRLALAAALAVIALMAWPMLRGRVHTYDDLGGFHLPVRAFYAERLSRGEPFDWMPQIFGGLDLTGEGQAGTYHPLHLFLYRCVPLSAAFELELLLSYPFMLAGTWLWLRRRLGRADAAMLGSLVFTFSGFNLLRFVHPNAVAITAHIPWLLWALDVAILDPSRGKRGAAEIAVALLTASEVLLGHPQFVWFSLVAETAYGAFLLWGRADGVMKTALLLAGAKLAGLLLGAVQILPTLEALANSTRAVQRAAIEVGAVHPLDLAQIVAPYVFRTRAYQFPAHEFPLYFGAVPLVLVAWHFARPSEWGRLRSWTIAAAVVGLLALVMALGRAGVLYRLQELLPLVSGFRCPARWLVLAHLAVAALAAMAFARLARRAGRPARGESKAPWVIVMLSVLVAAAALVLRHRLPISPTKYVLAGPLVIAAAAGLVAAAERGARWALGALVLLAAGDLAAYGLGYAVLRHTHPLGELIALTAVPPAGPGPAAGATLGAENAILLAGWHRVDGYAGLEPLRRLDYGQLAALRAAGVRWVRANKRTAEIAGLIDRGQGWLEVPEPLAPIRLVTRAWPSTDPARDIGNIPLATTALVDEPIDLPQSQPGVVEVLADRPGRLELETTCPGRQVLVVAQRFDRGWQALIGGRAEAVLRVNGDFVGCQVGAGRQRVVLEFRPRGLEIAWVGSLLGLALVAARAFGETTVIKASDWWGSRSRRGG